MGGDVKLVLRRSWAPGSHLTNTEQGGDSILVESADLSPSVRRLAVESAAVLDYEIAGINLIQHWATGSWHVIDVNATPAITTGGIRGGEDRCILHVSRHKARQTYALIQVRLGHGSCYGSLREPGLFCTLWTLGLS